MLSYFTRDERIDRAKLRLALLHLPPVAEMAADLVNDGSVQFCFPLHKVDRLLLPLLRWLCADGPLDVFELQEEARFAQFAAARQFCVRQSAVQKQARFARAAAECAGQVSWGFHGSASSNWHSIVRTKLQVLSGTPQQRSQPLHSPFAHPRLYGDQPTFSCGPALPLRLCVRAALHLQTAPTWVAGCTSPPTASRRSASAGNTAQADGSAQRWAVSSSCSYSHASHVPIEQAQGRQFIATHADHAMVRYLLVCPSAAVTHDVSISALAPVSCSHSDSRTSPSLSMRLTSRSACVPLRGR